MTYARERGSLFYVGDEGTGVVEVSLTGRVLSSLDLSGVVPRNGIEGVTIDEKGTLYLVAEQIQDGIIAPKAQSQLIVLTAPVPAPETWGMTIAGLGLPGIAARRRIRGGQAQCVGTAAGGKMRDRRSTTTCIARRAKSGAELARKWERAPSISAKLHSLRVTSAKGFCARVARANSPKGSPGPRISSRVSA